MLPHCCCGGKESSGSVAKHTKEVNQACVVPDVIVCTGTIEPSINRERHTKGVIEEDGTALCGREAPDDRGVCVTTLRYTLSKVFVFLLLCRPLCFAFRKFQRIVSPVYDHLVFDSVQ